MLLLFNLYYCPRNGHPLNFFPFSPFRWEDEKNQEGGSCYSWAIKMHIPTKFTGCQFSGDLLPHKFSPVQQQRKKRCNRTKIQTSRRGGKSFLSSELLGSARNLERGTDRKLSRSHTKRLANKSTSLSFGQSSSVECGIAILFICFGLFISCA